MKGVWFQTVNQSILAEGKYPYTKVFNTSDRYYAEVEYVTREFQRVDRKLNFRVEFSRRSSSQMALVMWRAGTVRGGQYKPGQSLYVEEISLKFCNTHTSTYELNAKREAWPKGSYAVEVYLKSALHSGRGPTTVFHTCTYGLCIHLWCERVKPITHTLVV